MVTELVNSIPAPVQLVPVAETTVYVPPGPVIVKSAPWIELHNTGSEKLTITELLPQLTVEIEVIDGGTLSNKLADDGLRSR